MTRAASKDALAAFSMDLLAAAGANRDSAEAATWAIMHASLHGIDSHGIRLLPWYAECLRGGLSKGSPNIGVSHPRRAAALVDADGGMGHIAAYRAMDEACGAKPLHGTSPIALAAPNPGGDAFLLDMATSSIPWNKVLKFRTEGLTLPPDVAVGFDGEFTADPHAAVALAPVGGRDYGYKGAGLAGLAEVLGGVLTGMRLSIEQNGLALADTRMGHFVMAIDPTLLMPMESFAARLTTYLDAFKSQPGTYAAGGPEWERRRKREAEGIPVPDGLYDELRACAAGFKVSFAL